MHTSNKPGDEYLRLTAMSNKELEAVFLRGQTPDLDNLVDFVYRGTNTPAWAKLLGIKKFAKGFYRGRPGAYKLDADGEVYGYNVPIEQNALTEPWHMLPSPAAPKRFGFYRVAPVGPEDRDNAYLHSVLLDYGKGGNLPIDPTSGLRDYVVRVEPGRDDLLLGKAYYRLGPLNVATSFFVLERMARA